MWLWKVIPWQCFQLIGHSRNRLIKPRTARFSMDDKRLFLETDSRHFKMPVLLNYTPFMGDIPFTKVVFNPIDLQLQH